jgi:hypothetical protein
MAYPTKTWKVIGLPFTRDDTFGLPQPWNQPDVRDTCCEKSNSHTRDQAFQLLHTEVIFCCKQIGSGRTVLAHYIETLVELLKHEASIIHTAQSLATVVLRRLTVRGFVRFVTALLLGIVSGGEPWNGQGCGWLGLCLAVTW